MGAPHSNLNVRVRVNALTVTFGAIDVVSNVDFDLRAGEISAVTGENGAGKSSLAKAIAGVHRPRFGSIHLDGHDVSFRNPREALAAGIALIHQEPTTFPDLDVADNIFAGHYPRRKGLADRNLALRRAGSLLQSLGCNLDPRARVDRLSVADRQFIEIASGLAHDAKVWIFDETTASLSPKEVDELFNVMRTIRDRGCALMMVSHHLHEVFKISDRITVLRDGIKVAERETNATEPREIVSLMVGREIEDSRLESGAMGEVQLRVVDLSGPGFREASFEVRRGEIVGIAGLVGSGRTELARCLFGITRPTQGKIEIEGAAVRFSSPIAAKVKGVALVPEDRISDGLFMSQSVGFNATIADLAAMRSGGLVSNTKVASAVSQVGSKLNLKFRGPEQIISELSGGNQQKVAIARWLATKPSLLILDEPTRGVDVGAKREVHRIVRDLANVGLAVLMISSDLKEILTLSDRVLVMREGRIAGELPPADASEEAIMLLATGEAAHR